MVAPQKRKNTLEGVSFLWNHKRMLLTKMSGGHPL